MWLTTLPLKDHGFHLDKRSHWDVNYIRYDLPLDKLPSNCVCGMPFTLDHALTCERGNYVAVRHNNIRDLTANLLSKVCNDVATSHWREFSNKIYSDDSEARVDISARSFWVRGQVALLDVIILIRSLTLCLRATRTRQRNTKLNIDDVSCKNSIAAQIIRN